MPASMDRAETTQAQNALPTPGVDLRMYYLALERDKQFNDVDLMQDLLDRIRRLRRTADKLALLLQDRVTGDAAARTNGFLRQDNLAFYTPGQTSEGTTMFRPLKKEIAGDGFELANEVKAHNHLAIPSTITQNYAVGSFPRFFKPDLDAYTHDDILDLIVFYNLDFGIRAGNYLAERIQRFRHFLTG